MGKSKKRTIRVSPRMQQVLDGELEIEDLEDDEIFRGQLKSEKGDFRGRPSDYIPRKFYDRAVAELMRRWQIKVNSELEPALQVLKDIASNPKLPADARYKSAVYLIERAAGKVPEKVDAKISVAKWEADIEGILTDVPEKKAG